MRGDKGNLTRETFVKGVRKVCADKRMTGTSAKGCDNELLITRDYCAENKQDRLVFKTNFRLHFKIFVIHSSDASNRSTCTCTCLASSIVGVEKHRTV